MNIRLKIKQLQDGRWAAFRGARYYASTVRETERDARIARLHQIGGEAQDTINAVDAELEKLGALDAKDPHGYLA